MIAALIFILAQLNAQEMSFFYHKNLVEPSTNQESELVEHTRRSYEKAIILQSKLTGIKFRETTSIVNMEDRDFRFLEQLDTKPYFHLINNLCSLEGVSHLHVGLLAGDSFIAALYGNQKSMGNQIGLDWFQECPRDIFEMNCKKHIDLDVCQIVDGPCFEAIPEAKNIDVFLYDADHSMLAHERAFTFYNDLFSPVFIAVVDDWECPWIRRPTFKAFEKLGYSVLYQAVIPGPHTYRSGQYVAVLRKRT